MNRTSGYRLIQACLIPEREEFRNVGVILQGTRGSPITRIAPDSELRALLQESGIPSSRFEAVGGALQTFTNHLFSALLSRPLDAGFAEMVCFGVILKVSQFNALELPPTYESADNLLRILVSRDVARG